MAEHLRVGEVLEERHDVGKRLVEGQDLVVAWLNEVRMHAIHDGMRCLMHDDVMRERGENCPVRLVITREIPEEECALVWAVVGIGGIKGVGIDTESLNVTTTQQR